MPAIGRILLELRFECTGAIPNLPFFHGPQWNGLLRKPLIACLMKDNNRADANPKSVLADAEIWIQPIDTFLCRYEPGDPIHLGLTFPAERATLVCRFLNGFNRLPKNSSYGQIRLDRLRLDSVLCRVSGRECPPEEAVPGLFEPLAENHLAPEAAALADLDEFSLLFAVPLRCRRPKEISGRVDGHKFMDPEFFLGPGMDPLLPVPAFVNAIVPGAGHGESLAVAGGGLTWADNTYGKSNKHLGGMLGQVRITGRPSPEAARALVAGQYSGLGKNRTFGLGFYTIPELDACRTISPLSRGRTLLNRACVPESLASALDDLPSSSPGPDGLTRTDLQKAGPELTQRISRSIMKGTYTPGPVKIYRMKKKEGGFREISVHNYTDRMVHRAFANHLAPAVDSLLSRSAYAFRKGLNRQGAARALSEALKEGYTVGVKADIAAFFDSVDLDRLAHLLNGLLGNDPLAGRIIKYLHPGANKQGKGLPQGSPLSPLLSNLYLDRFDKMITSRGLRLIRYADDLVVLHRPGRMAPEECLEQIRAALAPLGLELARDKTKPVLTGRPIVFLGYRVTPTGFEEKNISSEPADGKWLPVFDDQYREGRPVYLSSICRGAYSSGANLIINFEKDRKESIPWNRISRIVVVGRSTFSGGLIYRALRESVPVVFIDVMGAYCGRLASDDGKPPAMLSRQQQLAEDTVFCLDFARRIIAAQIHNRAVIVGRNQRNPDDLMALSRSAEQVDSIDQLRGIEGSAARLFFEHLRELVAPFTFTGRVYHPSPDPVNALLSFGYTLLRHRLFTALLHKGFDPWLGFYHHSRANHDALVSDLMEELRHVAERLVLAMIHRREIVPDDFELKTWGNKTVCRLKGEGFRKVIRRYETIMENKAAYRGKEKISLNTRLDEMADDLRRSIKLMTPYKPWRIY